MVFSFQITQLKIDNNPFAKGFRDREKVFPQKRPAPFIDQLREASETKHQRLTSQESDTEGSITPEKKNRVSPSSLTDSLTLYNNTKLELFRQQLARHNGAMMNPLLPFGLNKMPMMHLPFSLFPSRPCT